MSYRWRSFEIWYRVNSMCDHIDEDLSACEWPSRKECEKDLAELSRRDGGTYYIMKEYT